MAVLTPDQVAEQLQIRRVTVLDLARRGDLAGFQIGTQWRFHTDDVDDYIDRLLAPSRARVQVTQAARARLRSVA